MIRSNMWSRETTKDRRWGMFITSSPLLILAGVVTLALGGVVIALLFTEVSGTLSTYLPRLGIETLIIYTSSLLITTMIVAVMIILRLDELLGAVAIAFNLYVDWYLRLLVVSQIMAVALLLIFFLARSPRFSWKTPHALWLWGVFLLLTIFPAMRGIDWFDGASYYLSIIFCAFVMFWLGTVIAQDSVSVRRFFIFLSILGALVAIHTLIEAFTGVFLFKTTYNDAQLGFISDYELVPGYYRAESFLRNADSAGGFFSVMLIISLGLFAESTRLWKKILYFAEIFLILLALLFTYSAGGWVAALAGVCAFTILVGRTRYRILIPACLFTAAAVVMFYFPSQVAVLIQHATDPYALLLRNAIWKTALNVISAIPLTGIGMGRNVYRIRSNPYRVLGQYQPIEHPHNSYLEFAALGGIPVLLVFLALLSYVLWQAVRNWRLCDTGNRPLLAGGIAAVLALSVYSLQNAGWTLAPLAALGWLILGVTSSPLSSKNRNDETMRQGNENIAKNA